MKKYLLSLILALPVIALAQIVPPDLYRPMGPNKFDQNAEQCSDLVCVRKNIDAIDSQMVVLLGQRLAYVRRAGELKPPNVSPHDRTREFEILNKVGEETRAVGYSPVIARSVFSSILFQSNLFELRTRNGADSYNRTNTY